MASNILRHSGGIQLSPMTLPVAPVTGMIVLDIADGILKRYDGSQWQEVLDSGSLAGELTADNISYDNTGDFNTDSATEVESAIKGLDATLGDMPSLAPVNYTPVNPDVVADHLDAIDSALGNINVDPQFSDDTFRIQNSIDPTKELQIDVNDIAPNTTRVLVMPDQDVYLADIATNTAAIADIASDLNDAENNIGNLQSLGGVGGDNDLGSFTGSIIPDDSSIKQALQSLEDYMEALPDPITYAGTWDASTNTPTLADGDLTTGYLYRVNVAGTQDLGSGPIDFEVGDSVVNNGTVWEKWDHSDQVLSVNGQTGAVVLELDDLDDVNASAPNANDVLTYVGGEWIAQAPAAGYTDEQAQDAVGTILDDGSNGDIVFTYSDAVPRISAAIENDAVTTAKIAADAVSPSKIQANQTLRGVLNRSSSTSSFDFAVSVSETFYDQIALSASQTNTVLSVLTVQHAVHDCVEITYRIKQGTTNYVRLGTIRVVTDGTTAAITDTYTDLADLGITFSAAISGADLVIRYSSGANTAIMKADVKKFRAE